MTVMSSKPRADKNIQSNLSTLTKVIVKQYEKQPDRPDYEIFDKGGVVMYKVYETSHKFFNISTCLKRRRALELTVIDEAKTETISMVRPFRFAFGCFHPFKQVIYVFRPPTVYLGCVEQKWSCCFPKYIVKNVNDEVFLRVEGPCRVFSCMGGTHRFDIIQATSESIVGKIEDNLSSATDSDYFVDVHFFNIKFPINSDVNTKTILLAAGFLIGFNQFEINE